MPISPETKAYVRAELIALRDQRDATRRLMLDYYDGSGIFVPPPPREFMDWDVGSWDVENWGA